MAPVRRRVSSAQGSGRAELGVIIAMVCRRAGPKQRRTDPLIAPCACARMGKALKAGLQRELEARHGRGWIVRQPSRICIRHRWLLPRQWPKTTIRITMKRGRERMRYWCIAGRHSVTPDFLRADTLLLCLATLLPPHCTATVASGEPRTNEEGGGAGRGRRKWWLGSWPAGAADVLELGPFEQYQCVLCRVAHGGVCACMHVCW
jgi:hypothetical protein